MLLKKLDQGVTTTLVKLSDRSLIIFFRSREPRNAQSTMLESVATGLEPPQIREIEQEARRPPLHALTTLRFFAAMYVVFLHCGFENYFPPTSYLSHFFHSGYTGVTLFFVLSGFILTYNYPVVPDRLKFWISRFARIYPVYLLAFLLSLPAVVGQLLVAHYPRLWWGIPGSLLLVQAWDPKTATLINSPAWTLSVEAFFYALFPFLLPVLTRASRWAIATILCLDVLIALIPVIASDPGSRMWWADVLNGQLPLLRLGPFVVGVVAGLWYRNNLSSSVRFFWVGLAASLVLLFQHPPMYLMPIRDMGLSLSYCAIVYGLTNVKWVILTHPVALLLGEISYGVYILQRPVNRLMHLAGKIFGHWDPTSSTPLYLAVLLVFSYFSYRYIETPSRVWIRKLRS